MLLFHVNNFSFKEFWDVERHGDQDHGDDIGDGPHGHAGAGVGLPVVEGVAHGNVP